MTVAHSVALYGGWLAVTATAHIYTTLFTCVLYWYSMLSLLVGCHRLWSHRSFEASPSLQWFLMVGATIAYQRSVINWVRNHRSHHRYAGIGWMFVRRHPDVVTKGALIDLSDVERTPVVAFNKRHYTPLVIGLGFVLPLVVPVYGWNETWLNSLCVAVVLRWVCSLNAIFLLNSVAHKYVSRPFDRTILASELMAMTWMTLGESSHNYHHAFPWDYRASEGGFMHANKWFIEAGELSGPAMGRT